MTSSTDYVEAVQQISFVAGRVCFFFNKDSSVWVSAAQIRIGCAAKLSYGST